MINLLIVLVLVTSAPPTAAGGGSRELERSDRPAKAIPGDHLGGQPDDAAVTVEVELSERGRRALGESLSSTQLVTVGSASELRELLESGLAKQVWTLPEPKEHAVVSEGVGLTVAPPWQAAGYTGQGIKIAILDTGFSGFEGMRGVELPSSITFRSFHRLGIGGGGTTHGTAVAEIIFDLAPAASFLLVNFDAGGFDQAVDYLIAEDVDIVNMSAGWTLGPFDGTSPPAKAVDRAVQSGIAWVNSVGNYADTHYGGTIIDGDADGWFDFQDMPSPPGPTELDEFLVPAGSPFSVDLTWQPDARLIDLDLCVYDLAPINPVEFRCSTQISLSGTPSVESVLVPEVFGQDRLFGFAVYDANGNAAGIRFDVIADGAENLEFRQAERSLAVPADVERVLSVGAVAWNAPSVVEFYSSQGPTADGRVKPDLLAAARVSTQSLGPGEFIGTSASAPHVTGMAAIYLSAFPGTTPGALRRSFAALASPLVAGGGKNSISGWGLATLGAVPPRHSWIGVQDPTSGQWTLRTPAGTTGFFFGNPSDLPLMCDWDGDGIDTPGLYRSETGQLFLRNTNSQGVADIEIFYGEPQDLPVCGDWDGSGTETIGIYRPSQGRFFLRNANSQGTADFDFWFGIPGDVPFSGDWNRDGIDTVGLHRPTTGFVYITNANATIQAELEAFYGIPGDRFVVGDWDGDRRDSFGIFRPSEGKFYLSNRLGQSLADQEVFLGNLGSNPVSAQLGS